MLARQGWQVTGVDFSRVALDRAAELEEGGPPPAHRSQWVQADLLDYRPPSAAFDLVLLAYLHLPAQGSDVTPGGPAGRGPVRPRPWSASGSRRP